MKNLYRSPYEAYPFLCDDSNDLRCDFELLTDEIASQIGYLSSLTSDLSIKKDLLFLCELVYHLNPSLRTSFTITDTEISYLIEIATKLKNETASRCKLFVLPQGSTPCCLSHILRVKSKCLVRLLYRYNAQGNEVLDEIFDIANLLSGYFFYLALKLNELENTKEIEYISRNYK
ncbi:MAG: ATP--cob(I)alamin adenosyltransferase [Clostridia bacterium]